MKWLTVLPLVFLSSCVPWWNVQETYDPTFSSIPTIPIYSVQGIGEWLIQNIQYATDASHDSTSDYWQSPAQTYDSRLGDCEDYAILMMYLIHRNMEGWPDLIIGQDESGLHAWISYKGVSYEAQGGGLIDSSYDQLKVIPYGVAMWRSMNTHNSLQ